MPAVRPMGADSGVALPQSQTTLLRPVPTTGQVSQPLGSGALPHQIPLTSAPRGAVVLEGDYRATRVLPAVASQRQGSGAMRASVDMDGSDDQEVSFTGVVHKRTGLFCPRSGTGTQAGILCSTAKKTSSTDAQGWEKETYSRGSELFACERSHRTCQRPEQRILLKSVSGKKVRQWSRTDDQSWRAELLHKEEDVQDVHHQRRFSEYLQRRLGLHNRLERCLPPKQRIPEGSCVFGGRERASSSVAPPLQTKLCAQDFHKINLAINQINCLPRRLLVLARSRQELFRHTNIVLEILDQVRFQRNPKKFNLAPRQRFDYLGLQ